MEQLSKEQKIAAYKYALEELINENRLGTYCGICWFLKHWVIDNIQNACVDYENLCDFFPEFYAIPEKKGVRNFWWPRDKANLPLRIATIVSILKSLDSRYSYSRWTLRSTWRLTLGGLCKKSNDWLGYY